MCAAPCFLFFRPPSLTFSLTLRPSNGINTFSIAPPRSSVRLLSSLLNLSPSHASFPSAETYALPGQRPLYFLISDSATLRRDALSTYPDRVVISGLEQHHNDIERKKHNYELKKGEKKGEKEKEGAEVEEILRQLEGLHATVATSWIFAEMDFALLSYKSGFGRIRTSSFLFLCFRLPSPSTSPASPPSGPRSRAP